MVYFNSIFLLSQLVVNFCMRSQLGWFIAEFYVRSLPWQFNPLPDNKISKWSKLKAFADNKLNATQDIKVVFHRIENIVGKEENAGYQHFLLFPRCFQKAFPPICQKSSLWVKGLRKFLQSMRWILLRSLLYDCFVLLHVIVLLIVF